MESCWIIKENKVYFDSSQKWPSLLSRLTYSYDVTNYLKRHPAGPSCFLNRAKKMADTKGDVFFHSQRARDLWETMFIGYVDDSE